MNTYDHKTVEKKWQEAWEEEKLYTPDIKTASKKDKFYNLFMFPYPSAEGLHVGHAFSSIGSDIYGRFMRMHGKTVFQPMGYDSFGIHSENYAIKINENPNIVVKRTTKNYGNQLRSLGNGYDWTRTVTTSDPDYYKWTQWLFIEMYKAGLAYRKKAEVNFCPSCKTVLADEQVMTPKQAGKEARSAVGELIDPALASYGELRICERCGTVSEKRDLDQWFLKITNYAERLLTGLDKIDWSPRVSIAQREWIGRKEGRIINFDDVEIFTTRPETINSATFIAVSGEKDKFTGKFVVNPATNKKIPVWEAEYVLKNYGTGAIMGVPAYDDRDAVFAKANNINIVKKPFLKKILGEKKVNYHLRDWLVSRQRYWGAPIPMIYCEHCASLKGLTFKGGWFTVPENELPIFLPEISDYKPEGNGRGPLANHPEFFETKCPNCGGNARRETDVMDTFVDSSWYFLRYPSVNENYKSQITNHKQITNSKNKNSLEIDNEVGRVNLKLEIPWNREISKVWLPVDLYFGGAEHSVLHLMYARFVNMVMHDRGYLDHEEPFPKFFAHGLMIKDGAKMSKSRGNVVNPDEYVEKYGADTLRMYVMFMGPMDGYPDFRDSGIEGMSRFLKKVWRLFQITNDKKQITNKEVNYKLHQTIKGVTDDIKLFKYNTSIAKIMELVNVLSNSQESITKDCLVVLAKLLAPFAPHLAEELWYEILDQSISIHVSEWPKYDEKYLIEDQVTMVIQVNGKLRSQITINNKQITNKEQITNLAKADEKIKTWLEGKKIKKEIFVPGKLVNFVI